MMTNPLNKKKLRGFGLGLRTDHYQTILQEKPAIDWFEVITENYLVPGGKPLYFLDSIREHYPMVMHGVSMSIGSTDPLNWKYLHEVKQLADRIDPIHISDHLCWTGVQHQNTHDLLPLPYTFEAISHVSKRIREVQDFLERPFLIENVSSYISYSSSQMTEWAFIQEILNETEAYLLLDVNNIYVSSINHEFNPLDFIKAIPSHRVRQIHLAGHSNMGDYIIDTHDNPIIPPVWELYRETIRHHGFIPTMIERDDNIPLLSEVLKELNHARQIVQSLQEVESV